MRRDLKKEAYFLTFASARDRREFLRLSSLAGVGTTREDGAFQVARRDRYRDLLACFEGVTIEPEA